MQIYTSDKTTPRSFPWLWYLRLVAIIGTLIVLAITAQNSATFHSIGCDAPGRLNFNLAVVSPCPHVSVEYPLTLIPSRSSPSSPLSISSSPPVPPAPPGFSHGSYSVSWLSMSSCSSSGSPPARPLAIAAPTYATLAASTMDMSSSIPSPANVPPFSSNETIRQGEETCCSRGGAVLANATQLWVERSRRSKPLMPS